MSNLITKITTLLTLASIISCVNLYDLKNPDRKENALANLIKSEIYLIRTGDTEFDLRKNQENIFSYIYYDYSSCGQNIVTYVRKNLSIDEFKSKVPPIIENMKNTIIYRYFINHKKSDLDVYPFRVSPNYFAKFADKEQKNINLIKVTDDYICVSIKY